MPRGVILPTNEQADALKRFEKDFQLLQLASVTVSEQIFLHQKNFAFGTIPAFECNFSNI